MDLSNFNQHGIDGIGMTSQRTRDRLAKRIKDAGVNYEPVIKAIQTTPRHLFMDEAMATRAYEDTALPIGQGQTISQPFIVAKMTEALLHDIDVKKVLEIGTGSGYQTAILSQLVDEVFTIERLRSLMDKARRRLRGLNYNNINYLYGDGYKGWSAHAPYDGIIVTAAPKQIPNDLKQQLTIGGRMVIPVGDTAQQSLYVITRTSTGFEEQVFDYVSFVPLVKGEA